MALAEGGKGEKAKNPVIIGYIAYKTPWYEMVEYYQ